MKRTFTLLSLSALLLTACGSEKEASEQPPAPALPVTNVQVVTDWSGGNHGFRELRVNGIKCIEQGGEPTLPNSSRPRALVCNVSGIGS